MLVAGINAQEAAIAIRCRVLMVMVARLTMYLVERFEYEDDYRYKRVLSLINEFKSWGFASEK